MWSGAVENTVTEALGLGSQEPAVDRFSEHAHGPPDRHHPDRVTLGWVTRGTGSRELREPIDSIGERGSSCGRAHSCRAAHSSPLLPIGLTPLSSLTHSDNRGDVVQGRVVAGLGPHDHRRPVHAKGLIAAGREISGAPRRTDGRRGGPHAASESDSAA